MEQVNKGWFSEINQQWPGIATSLEVEEVLFHKQSKYQDVLVFKSKSFGNVLVLDGAIQLSERDEMAYQEMITHLPMFAHPNPENVLIVGAGDGGVLREVCKHSCVKEIHICEIDEVVIECGKKFLPGVASAWNDPRVTLNCGDAAEYIQRPEFKNHFDVIIVDSSDPVGPAEPLFGEKFYQDMYDDLRPGGRCCTQGESMWQHASLIRKLVNKCGKPFAITEYATTQVPTYPCGQIGLIVCSKPNENGVAQSAKIMARTDSSVTDLCNYYTPELHSAAFVLPAFLAKALNTRDE